MKIRIRESTLRNVLLRKNLSQNWLAHRLGISTGYMSQLMSGRRSPSAELREQMLTQFVSMTFDDLFEITEE